MAGCKPKKFAKGGFAYSGGKSLTDPKSGRPTGLGPLVPEPPRRPPQRSDIAAPPMGPKTGPVTGVTQTPLSPARPPQRSDIAAPTMGPKPPLAGPITGVTQTSLPTRGQPVNLGTAAGPGGGRPNMLPTQTELSAARDFMSQQARQGMGSQSVSPTQANKMGSMGAGVLGSMKPPAFKKGGMVNAKKKAKPAAGKSSTVRPRGSSGKGVKACKVC